MSLVDYFEGLSNVPPGSTETKQEIDARLGQGQFRARILRRWDGACAISGIRHLSVVRASHIRPWSRCRNEHERLDPANGPPLIPNYDVLFDRGFITFSDTGAMVVSRRLSDPERRKLALPRNLRRHLRDDEIEFMKFHRQHIFQ